MTLIEKGIKEIYIWEDYNRTPGSNTLIYLPLDTENGITNLGSGGVFTGSSLPSFGTYAGVDCGKFTYEKTYMYAYYNISLYKNYTMSMWIYNTNSSSTTVIDCDRAGIGFSSSGGSMYMGVITSSSGAYSTMSVSGVATNKWIYVVAINTAGTYRLSAFVDGTEIKNTYTSGYSYNNSYSLNVGTQNFGGYISNLIVENKSRTDAEITEYYNGTKGNYGL